MMVLRMLMVILSLVFSAFTCPLLWTLVQEYRNLKALQSIESFTEDMQLS